MARVSLIVSTQPDGPTPAELVPPLRRALESAGHEVEILVVAGAEDGPDWQGVPSSIVPGEAAAAMAGLERATGEILLVLDPGMGYQADDLPRVVAPLADGTADLAIASRATNDPALHRPRWLRALSGMVARPLTGTTDPLSGLIGLTRELREEASHRFSAVGSKFSFELLAKAGGRWADIPVRTAAPWRPRRPRLDDLRHLKRLSDYRFGNLSHLILFCAVGGSGMVVDLTFYFIFQAIFGQFPWLVEHPVPPTHVSWALAISRGLAIGVALVWNFTLNRRMTFSYARGGSAVRQFLTYLLSNALGVALSMALSLALPSRVPFFRRHKLWAAVVGIVAATGISFSMSRWLVFSRHAREPEPADALAEPSVAGG